jgi:hypothetical protein
MPGVGFYAAFGVPRAFAAIGNNAISCGRQLLDSGEVWGFCFF